ncbi:MAG: hypothetical protein ACRED0_08860 [Gammaproteobacteria bacterium]
MNIDDEALNAFTENLESARQVAQRLSSSIARLKGVFPLSSDVINDMDEAAQESLDAFVKRFEQLQDIIEGRLFRAIAYLEQEDVTRLSRRDLTMLMEKLGAIGSADSWSRLSLLRNKLAHEYPMDAAKQTERLNEAYVSAASLVESLTKLCEYVVSKGFGSR